MDAVGIVKSIEAIAAAVRDTLPHLREMKLDQVLGRGGGSGAGPVLVAIGAAAAVGAGVALLMAPRSGADLRSRLREKAVDLRKQIPWNGSSRGPNEVEAAGQARSSETLPAS